MFFSSLPNTAAALPNRKDRSWRPRWIPGPNICQSSQGVHHWWKIRARQRKRALQSSSDWWWAQTAGTLTISRKEVPEIWRKRSAALSTYKKSSPIRSWTLLLASEREEIAIISARTHPHWKTNSCKQFWKLKQKLFQAKFGPAHNLVLLLFWWRRSQMCHHCDRSCHS